MRTKHRNTLEAIFADPVSGTIAWRDIESLLEALGAAISEGSGSRVRFTINDATLFVHRPHPQPEAKKYVVRNVRDFLTSLGITP